MDILLTESKKGTLINPASIHGLLWLQTHFNSDHWEAISNGQVIIPNDHAQLLAEDASVADIEVNYMPLLAKNKKF